MKIGTMIYEKLWIDICELQSSREDRDKEKISLIWVFCFVLLEEGVKIHQVLKMRIEPI
jgi:hypothetical protein